MGPESGDHADRDPVMTEMRVVHLDDSDTEDRVVYLDVDPNPSDLRVIHADGDEVLGEIGTVTLTTVSVVIPSYNEAANIGWVLDRIPHTVNEIILVDGRSTDDTIAVARRHRPDVVVIEELTPGKGAAVRAGLQAATCDFVVMLDADGSMDPREIDLFIDSLADGNEIVKGTRFVTDGGSDDITRMRRFGNATFVRLANVMFDGHASVTPRQERNERPEAPLDCATDDTKDGRRMRNGEEPLLRESRAVRCSTSRPPRSRGDAGRLSGRLGRHRAVSC